jgi:hypothetical protein
MDQAGVCLGSAKLESLPLARNLTSDRLRARRNNKSTTPPPIAPAKPRSLGSGPAHVRYSILSLLSGGAKCSMPRGDLVRPALSRFINTRGTRPS